MNFGSTKHSNERGWVWTWLLLLALLLLLIKSFLLGTYYVASPRALLFVAIQSMPHAVGDELLVELVKGEIVPAEYREQSGERLLVEVGGEPIQIVSAQVKGKVIGRLRL